MEMRIVLSVISDTRDSMNEPLRPRKVSVRRSSPCSRWRHLVAPLTLAALVLPSLGALPWIAADFVRDHGIVGQQELSPAADHRDAHHEHNTSDIPGSPLHPIDHDCFPCKVLAQLSRCALYPPAILNVAVVPLCPVRPLPIAVLRIAAAVAELPPVRAPPASIA